MQDGTEDVLGLTSIYDLSFQQPIQHLQETGFLWNIQGRW